MVPEKLWDKLTGIYRELICFSSNAGGCAPCDLPMGGCHSLTPHTMEDKESSAYNQQNRAYNCYAGAPNAESVLQ